MSIVFLDSFPVAVFFDSESLLAGLLVTDSPSGVTLVVELLPFVYATNFLGFAYISSDS